MSKGVGNSLLQIVWGLEDNIGFGLFGEIGSKHQQLRVESEI